MNRAVAVHAEKTEVERVFREVYGRALATLIRFLGDITLAEDAVQEAFVAANDRWRSDGIPPNPAGWIVTTARNRAIDELRRSSGGEGSMNSFTPSQPLRTKRPPRRGERTDRCGTTDSG